ncbi:3-phosphoglycerate dehydrogenase [Bacillus salipaludis]|uniref:3-phosphoglycerate dehydrogenase n=1 Tax=Bacillus salipaludis TaxID=2547811 RepID=A0A4R5VL44_9BACI|nr:NAD(P)-dependent oxidoreductase [Bacillus salipaludis]MDQ6599093.1 NAD(P)-dependent oxidoreductase [Bacillus salipaludis]TDK58745.1 3-phosphoglycerate dehydrogenase [Bacillus salipaludis]
MLIVYPDADPQFLDILTDDLLRPLKQIADIQIYEGRPKTQDEFINRVKDADGILLGWSIPNEVIMNCPKLKIISFTGIGASNFVDLNYTASLGITVTNTPGYADNAVAEHTISLLFSLAKNIHQNHLNVSRGIWDQNYSSFELRGKTIGLIGLGGIGHRMAELCKALGMKILCWTFNPNRERGHKLDLTFTSLEELLKTADIVSLHIPFTNQTRNLLGKKELSLMKQGSFFLNTSRAEIVDTSSLVELLKEGGIAGAGIDVYDEEPIKKDNPLLSLSNVVLSPHIAFNTPEASREIFSIAINNLVQFFSKNYLNVVN